MLSRLWKDLDSSWRSVVGRPTRPRDVETSRNLDLFLSCSTAVRVWVITGPSWLCVIFWPAVMTVLGGEWILILDGCPTSLLISIIIWQPIFDYKKVTLDPSWPYTFRFRIIPLKVSCHSVLIFGLAIYTFRNENTHWLWATSWYVLTVNFQLQSSF